MNHLVIPQEKLRKGQLRLEINLQLSEGLFIVDTLFKILLLFDC